MSTRTPLKYRKRPVVIEAMQWDGTADGATAIIDWVLAGGGTASYSCGPEHGCAGEDTHWLMITTLEGRMRADSGWWVIRGIAGEFYPHDPDIFPNAYDPAHRAPCIDGEICGQPEHCPPANEPNLVVG